MTKLLDARPVLKGYYLMHGAIRADLQRIDAFIVLTPQERTRHWEGFWRWFQHHLTMLHAHDRSESDFFFPEFQQFFKDEGAFVEFMHVQGEAILELERKVVANMTANPHPADDEVCGALRAYVAAVAQHLDDEEVRCVPIMLEHYTRETLLPLELRFLRSLSLKDLGNLLPWMVTWLTPAERQEAISSLPLPARIPYLYLWEPAYLRRQRLSYFVHV